MPRIGPNVPESLWAGTGIFVTCDRFRRAVSERRGFRTPPRKMHRRKIVKYTLRTLLGLVAALVLIPASLYIPAVQDFVRIRAERSVARSLGMELSIGRIRLAFPLRLSADDVLLRQRGDTLVRCGRLSLAVALLPLLSRKLKAGEIREAAAVQDKAVIYGLMMSLPAAVLFVCLADSLIELLFEHGRFTASDTYKTALALKAYAVGLPCYVMVKALMPNFFARGDTTTPVKYSFVVFLTNLALNLLLMKPFGHVGIAAATSAAAFVSLYQYVRGLKKRGFWSFSAELKRKIFDIFLCTFVMGILVYGTQAALNRCFPTPHIGILILKLAAIGTIGLATFLIGAKIRGILDITAIAKNLVLRRKKA